MKNSATAVLLAVTLAFAAFVGGFCLGRSYGNGDVEVSAFMAAAPSPSAQAVSNASTASADVSSPATDSSTSQSASTAAPSESQAIAPSTQSDPFPININTATLEQLKLLNGIGDVYAQRILDYRAEIGQFQHIEELLDVKGIGEKTLEKIRPYITIEGGNP